MNTPSPETGLSLKVRRVAADVSSTDLADAMGVTVSRLSHIEGSRKVTAKAADKYIAALQTLTTKSTEAA
jgi:predicted transcriptional regulator